MFASGSQTDFISHPASALPAPRIMDCCFDGVFLPALVAMHLDWQETSESTPHAVWDLPRGIRVYGPAPFRFGVQILRGDVDSFLVRMVWNDMQFGWARLSRLELLESSLSKLLRALGTQLEYLLDQPIQSLE